MDVFEPDSLSVVAAITSKGKSRAEVSSGDSDLVVWRSKSTALSALSLLNDVGLLGGESGIENG